MTVACNSVKRLELGPLSWWSAPSSPFRWSGLHLPTPSPWGLLLVPPHIPMALGAAARPESPVPAHYHCLHLHCNPTPAFQRVGLPSPPTVVSVQAQRQGPSRGQHSQIPLPGKVCPSETLTCWGGHERLPLGSSLHLILSDSPLPISLLCAEA